MIFLLCTFLVMLVVICCATYAALRLARVKGLRSSRGLTVFLLLVLSWGVGVLASYVYVPLGVIVPLALQFCILAGIARLSIAKSFIIAIVYSVVVIGATWSVALLYFASPFYTESTL